MKTALVVILLAVAMNAQAAVRTFRVPAAFNLNGFLAEVAAAGLSLAKNRPSDPEPQGSVELDPGVLQVNLYDDALWASYQDVIAKAIADNNG